MPDWQQQCVHVDRLYLFLKRPACRLPVLRPTANTPGNPTQSESGTSHVLHESSRLSEIPHRAEQHRDRNSKAIHRTLFNVARKDSSGL